MTFMFIFGLGYSAKRIRKVALGQGWQVSGTGSDGDVDFSDASAVKHALNKADYVLSSVPPVDQRDPVLDQYDAFLAGFRGWMGYLSSSGVYGDAGGAWVDESSPTGTGRRRARAVADANWLELGARVFRLPGIYGPGRSVFDRIASGKAHRIDLPRQIFSRIHVDDIAGGVMAAMLAGDKAPAGAYNLADNCPASHNAVTEEACRLMGAMRPPLQSLEEAGLSPMARGFYAENRRVSNETIRRTLGWSPLYPDFSAGLRAIWDG